MDKFVLLLILHLTVACNKQIVLYPGQKPPADWTSQLVVVRSPTEASTQASLQRFEKIEEKWQPVGRPVAVTVGRSGLAWGSGEHQPQAGLQKREGDGKSPAGIYSFGQIFGYAPPAEVSFKMPYVHADETLECVDDSKSFYYNRLINSELVKKDWSSSEQMRRPDHQYRWGVVVNHNTPAVAQGGSCIFLHIWKEPGASTSGCTAMSEPDLLELLHWLDPAKFPQLLQVTEADYPAFRKKYSLPE